MSNRRFLFAITLTGLALSSNASAQFKEDVIIQGPFPQLFQRANKVEGLELGVGQKKRWNRMVKQVSKFGPKLQQFLEKNKPYLDSLAETQKQIRQKKLAIKKTAPKKYRKSQEAIENLREKIQKLRRKMIPHRATMNKIKAQTNRRVRKKEASQEEADWISLFPELKELKKKQRQTMRNMAPRKRINRLKRRYRKIKKKLRKMYLANIKLSEGEQKEEAAEEVEEEMAAEQELKEAAKATDKAAETVEEAAEAATEAVG